MSGYIPILAAEQGDADVPGFTSYSFRLFHFKFYKYMISEVVVSKAYCKDQSYFHLINMENLET